MAQVSGQAASLHGAGNQAREAAGGQLSIEDARRVARLVMRLTPMTEPMAGIVRRGVREMLAEEWPHLDWELRHGGELIPFARGAYSADVGTKHEGSTGYGATLDAAIEDRASRTTRSRE